MHTLHFSPGACSLASHIALAESGLDYKIRKVDFKAEEQKSAAYAKVNPKGRVPALETPRGVLTETPAILAYIGQTAPRAGLVPLNDPFAFAQMQAFNSYLCSTVHVAHAHKFRGTRWASEPSSLEDMKRNVPRTMTACFEAIENGMLKGPWAMGEAYTVADPYLFTVSRWLEGDQVDLSRLPRVADHMARMGEREAVKRALEAEAA